jgi:hypothetical protein
LKNFSDQKEVSNMEMLLFLNQISGQNFMKTQWFFDQDAFIIFEKVGVSSQGFSSSFYGIKILSELLQREMFCLFQER